MDNQAGPDFNFRIPGKDWAFGYNFTPPGNGWIWVAKDAHPLYQRNLFHETWQKYRFTVFISTFRTPLPVHCVFDETMRKSGPLYPNDYFFCWWSEIEKYKWSEDSSEEIEKGWIIKADTLRELAVKIDKDPDRLEKTVNTWNRSCAEGNDSEFDRNPKKMAPIQTPPYLRRRVCSRIYQYPGGTTAQPQCPGAGHNTQADSEALFRRRNGVRFTAGIIRVAAIFLSVLSLAELRVSK